MICKDFENWMQTNGAFDQEDTPADEIIKSHLNDCPTCSGLYAIDQAMEKSIENGLGLQELPDGLIAKVDICLDHALKTRNPEIRYPYKKIGLITGFALIAIATFFFLNRPFRYDTLQQLGESAVVRHLDGNSAMSFLSDEIDQARIMMSKELKFNVILPDLKDQGYVLLGGRLCFLGKCKIAYLFYEKFDKPCSLFILDYDHLNFKMADGSQYTDKIKGLNTRIWKKNDQVYAMVF